jgi:hypothetical protein
MLDGSRERAVRASSKFNIIAIYAELDFFGDSSSGGRIIQIDITEYSFE